MVPGCENQFLINIFNSQDVHLMNQESFLKVWRIIMSGPENWESILKLHNDVKI